MSGQTLSDFHVRLAPSNRLQFSVAPARPPRKKSKADEKNPALVSLPNCNAANSGGFGGVSPLIDGVLVGGDFVGLAGSAKLGSWSSGFLDVGEHFGEIFSVTPVASNNCSRLPPTPRPKVFTSFARQKIMDAGGALEKEGYRPEQIVFATFTLPGGTDQAKEILSRYSRECVNTMKTWLRRRGINLTINTWEWQKRGALHLHLIYVCTSLELMRKLETQLQEEWFNILDNISKKSGVNLYQRDGFDKTWTRDSKPVVDNCCKIIQCDARSGSSPIAYLSKYVGKGSKVPEYRRGIKLAKSFNTYYPSSWWSISKEVCALIQKHSRAWVVRLPKDFAISCFFDMSQDFSAIARLSLNPINPYGNKDYYCRNLYLYASDYEETIETFDGMFTDMNARYKYEVGDAYISNTVALDWLSLEKNYDLRNSFECYAHSISYEVFSDAASFFRLPTCISMLVKVLNFLKCYAHSISYEVFSSLTNSFTSDVDSVLSDARLSQLEKYARSFLPFDVWPVEVNDER